MKKYRKIFDKTHVNDDLDDLYEKKSNSSNIIFNIIICSLIFVVLIVLIVLVKTKKPDEIIQKPGAAVIQNSGIKNPDGLVVPKTYLKEQEGHAVEYNISDKKVEIPEVFVLQEAKSEQKNLKSYKLENYFDELVDEKGNVNKDAIKKIFADMSEILKQLQKEHQDVHTAKGNPAEGLVDNLINNMLPGLSSFYGTMGELMENQPQIQAQLQNTNNDIIIIPANEPVRQQLKQLKDYNSVSYKGYLRREMDLASPEKTLLIFYVTDVVLEKPEHGALSGSAGS